MPGVERNATTVCFELIRKHESMAGHVIYLDVLELKG